MPKGTMGVKKAPEATLEFIGLGRGNDRQRRISIPVTSVNSEQGHSELRTKVQQELREACGRISCPAIVNLESTPLEQNSCPAQPVLRELAGAQVSCMESVRDCALLVETPQTASIT